MQWQILICLCQDGSSAEYGISVVEYGGLSRSDCALRFAEGDLQKILAHLFHNSRLFRLAVAHLYFSFCRSRKMIPGDQIDIADKTVVGHQILLFAEDHGIILQGFSAYIE